MLRNGLFDGKLGNGRGAYDFTAVFPVIEMRLGYTNGNGFLVCSFLVVPLQVQPVGAASFSMVTVIHSDSSFGSSNTTSNLGVCVSIRRSL